MRIWSGEGGLMTDEQVLAYLGHFGSLSKALQQGDITLVSGGTDTSNKAATSNNPSRRQRKTKLADYL